MHAGENESTMDRMRIIIVIRLHLERDLAWVPYRVHGLFVFYL